MVEPALSKDRIQRLVEAAGEQLTGDWVLVGGALAALWFSPDRVTEDVDLIAVAERPDRARWRHSCHGLGPRLVGDFCDERGRDPVCCVQVCIFEERFPLLTRTLGCPEDISRTVPDAAPHRPLSLYTPPYL